MYYLAVSSNISCGIPTLAPDFQNRKTFENRATFKNVKTNLAITRTNGFTVFMRKTGPKLSQSEYLYRKREEPSTLRPTSGSECCYIKRLKNLKEVQRYDTISVLQEFFNRVNLITCALASFHIYIYIPPSSRWSTLHYSKRLTCGAHLCSIYSLSATDVVKVSIPLSS
jgi:hypothetical protein